MSWQDAVERTVAGMGYDLVDATRSVGGLLCVFIDHLPAESGTAKSDIAGRSSAQSDATRSDATRSDATGSAARFITVDDCEQVTRQLQHVLEVDDVAYERLEVSSPGLDRPLKKPADYARFVGEEIELTLKAPFKGRKRYRGELLRNGDGWRLLLADARAGKGGLDRSRSKVPAGEGRGAAVATAEQAPADLALDFSLEEIRDAHLVPVVDFKGRRMAASPAGRDGSAPGLDRQPAASAYPIDEVDGGQIQ